MPRILRVSSVVILAMAALGVALARLGGKIDDQTMRRLNYQVTVERRSEAEVAHAFLRREGLLERAK